MKAYLIVLYAITGVVLFTPWITMISLGIAALAEHDCYFESIWLLVGGITFLIQTILLVIKMGIMFTREELMKNKRANWKKEGFSLILCSILSYVFLVVNVVWIIVGGVYLEGIEDSCTMVFNAIISTIVLGFVLLIVDVVYIILVHCLMEDLAC